MFLKSYKVKSNTPLKSSEVKKLKQRIQTEFPGSNHEVLIVPKSNVTMLKLVTHTNVQTNVYCVDKVPMFFENVEHKLVPTVYSLWQVPDLLPYFTTHADVLPKLSNGANLMLPGVVPQGTGVNIYGHYRKGQFGKTFLLVCTYSGYLILLIYFCSCYKLNIQQIGYWCGIFIQIK